MRNVISAVAPSIERDFDMSSQSDAVQAKIIRLQLIAA